jgi:uncharacterized protein YdeI (BOF family)
MKNVLSALLVSMAVGSTAAVLSAQQPQPQQQPPTPPAVTAPQTAPAPKDAVDVTLTGCLVQGSAPNVFVFQNAKKDSKSTAEKGVSYVVVASGEALNLRNHLNHEIQISGQSDGKIAPVSTERASETELPKLTAKNITMIANTCATTTAASR